MSDVAKREPGRPLGELFDWFDTGLPSWGELWRRGSQPIRIEDRREEDRYVVRAELPGIDPNKDVEITVEHGVLTVSAERREESSEKGRSEFRYGSFRRSVTLPPGAQEDDVRARYQDGILEVTVPITAGSAKPRTIPVSRQQSESQVPPEPAGGTQSENPTGSSSEL